MSCGRKFYFYLLLAAAETIALVWFSFLPSVEFARTGAPLRPGDLEHFVAYGVYGFLLSRLFGHFAGRRKFLFTLILPLAVGSLVGLTCETIQLFVPTRTADALDWAMDALGAFCGAALGTKLASKFKAL